MDQTKRANLELDPRTPARADADRDARRGAGEAAPHDAAAADVVVKRMLGSDATRVANDFYAAFAARDAATMTALYAPNVRFHDPLFGDLHGSEVMLMWTSIMPKANPFQVTPGAASLSTLRADGAREVHLHWDAHYGLGKANIVNHSDTTLVIKDGQIIEQRDVWNLDAWTAQALPAHLGGHAVSDLLTHAAAHAYIAVVDTIRRS